jgi:hypothetical protein
MFTGIITDVGAIEAIETRGDLRARITTAYDMALITAHAMSIPKFREICLTDEIKISWPGRPYDRLLRNQNRLLELYDGADLIEAWSSEDGHKAPFAETPIPAGGKIHREGECVGRVISVPCQLVPSRSEKA